jgi:hypothetical protein
MTVAEPPEIRDMFAAVRAAVEAAHRVAPLEEVVAMCARGSWGVDPWDRWTLRQRKAPSDGPLWGRCLSPTRDLRRSPPNVGCDATVGRGLVDAGVFGPASKHRAKLGSLVPATDTDDAAAPVPRTPNRAPRRAVRDLGRAHRGRGRRAFTAEGIAKLDAARASNQHFSPY